MCLRLERKPQVKGCVKTFLTRRAILCLPYARPSLPVKSLFMLPPVTPFFFLLELINLAKVPYKI